MWAGEGEDQVCVYTAHWVQHGKGARVLGCRETWEDPEDRGGGARGLVWVSRNVFYGAALHKGVGESFPAAWGDWVAFLGLWSGRHAWQLYRGLSCGHAKDWVRRAVGLQAEQLLLGEPSGCLVPQASLSAVS